MRYHGSEEIAVQVVIQPGAAHIFEHSLHYAVYPAGVFAHVFTAIFYVIAAAQRVLKIFYALSLFRYYILRYGSYLIVIGVLEDTSGHGYGRLMMRYHLPYKIPRYTIV